MKLPLSFYLQPDVVRIGKKLLGKYIFTNINDVITGGMIVETESYKGIEDKASHAYKGRYTARTKTMYEAGGITYVYFCYGVHHLLNIVTNEKHIPDAVLIRAIEPTEGIEEMLRRRNKSILERSLTAGPGVLCQALGIDRKINNVKLNSSIIWVEEGNKVRENAILCSPRVGVAYAEEHALLPWRFRLKKNNWTSPAK